jgi:hypothetical protein
MSEPCAGAFIEPMLLQRTDMLKSVPEWRYERELYLLDSSR